jgi:hypothetical protein
MDALRAQEAIRPGDITGRGRQGVGAKKLGEAVVKYLLCTWCSEVRGGGKGGGFMVMGGRQGGGKP